jgi:6,7-dimethyl-8-ribityllumazine synthase
MSSKNKNLSTIKDNLSSAEGFKFGIVVSEWNKKITGSLYKACIKTLKNSGAEEENIKTVWVPGTFELPVAAKMLLGNDSYDAIICMGCVIKGETNHDEYISNAVANGLINLGVLSGKPIIFGVLTPNTEEQAKERAGGKYGNKGIEAAQSAIQMVNLKSKMKNQKTKIGF